LVNRDALANFYWNRFLAKRFVGEMKHRNANVYDKHQISRPSDTVYVLACGASINDVSAEQWHEIRQHYSIGVNAFYVHNFNANVYFTEYSDNEAFQLLISKCLFDNNDREKIQKYISAYHVLVEAGGYKNTGLSSTFFYSPDRIRTRDTKLLKRIAVSYFSKKNTKGKLLHQISNLDVVINYCVIQGFKKIILVGVDLNHDGYFWETKEYPESVLAKKFMDSFRAGKGEIKGGFHATATNQQGSALGRFNIVEYLKFLNSDILDKEGVTISVASSKSLLAKHIPFTPIPELQGHRE
jgi:hypothetical protein